MRSTKHQAHIPTDTLTPVELNNWSIVCILQINFSWGIKVKKSLERELVSEKNKGVTPCQLIPFLCFLVIVIAQAAQILLLRYQNFNKGLRKSVSTHLYNIFYLSRLRSRIFYCFRSMVPASCSQIILSLSLDMNTHKEERMFIMLLVCVY